MRSPTSSIRMQRLQKLWTEMEAAEISMKEEIGHSTRVKALMYSIFFKSISDFYFFNKFLEQ